MAEENKEVELERKLVAAEERANSADIRAKQFEAQLVDLQKQIEKFSGVDLDALKAAKEENEILKRQTAGIDEGKFNETVEEKVKSIRQELQKKLEELTNVNKNLSAKVHDFEIVGESMKHLGDKLKPDMQDFVKEIIRKSLRKDGDQLVVYEGDEKVFSKQDVSKQMGAEEFYGIIQEKFPSAFRESVPAGTKTANERASSNTSVLSVVEKLKNPDTAKSLTKEEINAAGVELYKKYKRY